MRTAIVVLVSAAVLALAGPAAALVLAPPGKSGASQYVEVLPTSSGNAAPPGSVPGSATGGSISRLGAGAAGARALGRLGSDGKAAAAVATATAPVAAAGVSGSQSATGSRGGSHPGGGAQAGHGANATALSGTGGQSLPSGVAGALTGGSGGGIGAALPILLITSLLVSIGIGIARLRRTNDPPAAA